MKKIMSCGLTVFCLLFLAACGGGSTSTGSSGSSGAAAQTSGVRFTCAGVEATSNGACTGQYVSGVDFAAGLALNSPAIYNGGSVSISQSQFLTVAVSAVNNTPASVNVFYGVNCTAPGTSIPFGVESVVFTIPAGKTWTCSNGWNMGTFGWGSQNLGSGHCDIGLYNADAYGLPVGSSHMPALTNATLPENALATARMDFTVAP